MGQNCDFFEVQRRLRIRSRALLGGFFFLLWLIANAVLVGAHTRRVCRADGACDTAWFPNVGVVAATAAVVIAYLVCAPAMASRLLVPAEHRVAETDTVLLRNVVEEVAIAAGVPTPRAFVLDDPSRNAFAVSDGRRHGAVVVTSGLLAALDRRELTGIVAHEVAHIRNRDSRVILVAVFAVGAVVAVSVAAMAVAATIVRASSTSRRKDDGASLVMVLAVLALLAALVLRIVAVPAALLMRAALSRRREQLADASAVQFTRDPGGLRRALEKVAASAEPLRHPRALARPLYIDMPPGQVVGGVFARWLDTHPPIEERIAWLRHLEREPDVA